MPNKFKPVESLPNFSKLEEEVLEFWKKDDTFRKSVEERPRDKSFSFYDGPPFATGLPHYGHIVPGTIKDIIPRFKTMQGFRVERRFGWDCHGLPIEYEMEKQLKISGKRDIEKMGIDKFNEACRGVVLKYAKEWEVIIGRLGRWIDFKKDYKTMDATYMESVWWVFKTLFDKKLIYEGYKSMHLCPRCATTLSNFEVTLNYKDKTDESVYVKFELVDAPKTYFIAWTTTPWTLPGNMLLAVNPKLKYARVTVGGEKFILLASKVDEVRSMNKEVRVEAIDIKNYIGKKYKQLPFKVKFDASKLHHTIVNADFVTEGEGTGVVHVAPAFGEDDLNLGKKLNAAFVQHINISGEVIPEVLEGYANESVFKLNKDIIIGFKNNILKTKPITHSYPLCWRCDTPLLNYATKSWFVETTKIKKNLLSNNDKIHWVPEHIKIGRFGQWLLQVRDWAISRSRYWGTPLPVWECEKCHEQKIIGSVHELEELTGMKVKDLHKHFVDKLIFKCECGGKFKRIAPVFDCWFESGAMPYGSNHYPFENKEKFDANHPADFISEGIDQTRGWFYTLHVLGVALFDKPAFKNCVVHGIVLAEDGQKMSKRKKNYPDPLLIVKKYGADSLRYFLMNSTVIKGEDLRFSEKGVSDVARQIFLPIWNTYIFFQKNIEIDNFQFQNPNSHTKSNNLLDQWITSRLNSLNKTITESLENYDIYEALKPVRLFVEDLSAWYIRRSRKRVGLQVEEPEDKQGFYETTYQVLTVITKLLAPFTPFFAEMMWQNLGNKTSVHLSEWPKVNRDLINDDLEKQMEFVRKICEMGNAKRKELKIKVRQPLSELRINELTNERINDELLLLVKNELNVKQVKFVSGDAKELQVEYDTKITPLLKAEGEAREIIRALQNLRKLAGCEISEQVDAEAVGIPSGFEQVLKKEVLIRQLTKGTENKIIRISK